MPLPYNALPIPVSCNFTIKTAVLRFLPQHGCPRLFRLFHIGIDAVLVEGAQQ